MSASTISAEELFAESNDRFHRLKLISWWDQELLFRSRVLVVGAGALGNEIIKNLALLGVGNLFIADMDTIENSNLSRSVLYRESDCGRPKAEVAAEVARSIFPRMRTRAFCGNVVYDLGLGVYEWADVVISGLDNREARLEMNRACHKTNKTYIDGAIEQLDGVARVFRPDGPCYECTMNKRDWELLDMRRSCALLTRDQMLEGKVPTTPTVSSIIAAVEVQEAIKLLHGREAMAGKGFAYMGLTNDSYVVEYQRKDDCYSHDHFDTITSYPGSAADTTWRQLLEASRAKLGPEAVIDLNTDILVSLACQKCGKQEPLLRSLGKVTQKEGRCPTCGEARELETISAVYGDEALCDRTLAESGIPAFDIVTARDGDNRVHWRLEADRQKALGGLADGTPLP